MGAPEKLPIQSNSMQRVKVYRLNDDGKWDDQGTGHVTVDYLERSEDLGLFVIDEEDKETLLLHRITPDDIYRKQEDTIISWRDPEYSTELALSFQETAGCSYIWDHICNVQRSLRLVSINHETFHSVNSELRELPAVELSTLPLILKRKRRELLTVHCVYFGLHLFRGRPHSRNRFSPFPLFGMRFPMEEKLFLQMGENDFPFKRGEVMISSDPKKFEGIHWSDSGLDQNELGGILDR